MTDTTHSQILEKLGEGCERCGCPTELWSVHDTCEKWFYVRELDVDHMFTKDP